MRYYSTSATLILVSLLWLCCTKISPFGSELLDDQLGDYAFTDTLTLRCTIEQEDEVFTSDRSNGSPYLLCGELNDPEFGKTTADIYSLVGLPGAAVRFDTSKLQVDSIVMYLRYDITGVYGDTTTEQTLKVFQLDEELIYTREYQSSASLRTLRELGSVRFVPRPSKKDSLSIAAKAPFLRVKLDNNFGKLLTRLDSASLVNDTILYDKIKGFKITCAPSNSSDPGAILAFNLNDPNFSLVRLYFKEDTTKRRFDLRFLEGRLTETNKFNHFSHDYGNSVAGKSIGQPGNELMYVQGAKGIRIKIEIPYVANLDNIAINKAELIITAKSPASNAFPLPSQLSLTETIARNLTRLDSTILKSLVGNYQQDLVGDMYVSLGPSLTGGLGLFGGKPVSATVGGNAVKQYRMILTDRFQAMVDDTKNNTRLKTIYLKVYPNRSFASRSILYGPKSTEFPAKLALKYTKLR